MREKSAIVYPHSDPVSFTKQEQHHNCFYKTNSEESLTGECTLALVIMTTSLQPVAEHA
jgi:hypothetical protein